MQADARIIVHHRTTHILSRTVVQRDYEWQGIGNVAFVDLYELEDDMDGAHVGQMLRLGQLCVVVIARDPARFGAYVTRHTSLAFWYIARAWVERHMNVVNQRVLATLAVWGLAEWKTYRALSWRDVHLLRWLKRKIGR